MRSIKGKVNYHAGLAAEESVKQAYLAIGARVLAQRWRGQGGEIDLIVHHGGYTIFVEVKKAASHEQAAQRLSPKQLRRIAATSEEYMAQNGHNQFADMRIDLALVDQIGRVEILHGVGMMH